MTEGVIYPSLIYEKRMHRAAQNDDWEAYDRAYNKTHEHYVGCIPLMVTLVEKGQRERLRLMLAEYLNDERNHPGDITKHAVWAATQHNRYGILKMLIRYTDDREIGRWKRDIDSKRLLGTVLWLGEHSLVPSHRLIKMLTRVREGGYRFDECDFNVNPNRGAAVVSDWVRETMAEEMRPRQKLNLAEQLGLETTKT